ncbi:MAG: FKBP-type peptidyl-prolyl cis-trans isomerase, partial [Nitrosopumilaceae archaeon]|nr:FKBP-type peptidyl-prolyl cis-trans isomerase [Nitrosopumilaceae archaeon]
MTFDKGSLILIDYVAKVKDSDEVFDTTIEEEAKKHSIHESDVKYSPKLVSVGEVSYPVLKGLDEALTKTTVGDKLTVEVTPDKGFGERDSTKVRMIPIRKLGEDADKVTVGDTIEIDNKRGIIRFIGSGRVQIDYNHKYAGKTILYDVNVIKSLESESDKVDGILK